MRKKTFQVWREAAKVGAYAEMPMLPDDKQVQVHLSKNDRPQPFYLICGKDCCLYSCLAPQRSSSRARELSTLL